MTKINLPAKQNWTLTNITKEQFLYLYGDTVDIYIFENEPENDADLVNNYLTSKLWRLNNVYTFVDKNGIKRKFEMNLAQHKVYSASLLHSRLIILKSRQQGISTFWLISFFDDFLFIPNYTIGLMAQGDDESMTLLLRVKTAWDNFPEELTEFLNISLTTDNNKKITLSNGSTIYIRTSFRSATLQRLHISEYGKICAENPKKAKETRTGTLQAIRPGNTVIIESTAEGDNEFKLAWDLAIEAEIKSINNGTGIFAGKDFKPIFLSWLDDPDCVATLYEEPTSKQEEYFNNLEQNLDRIVTIEQRNFWIQQYRELGEDIYQEYPATAEEAFTKHDGSYYAKQYLVNVVKQNRIIKSLYDPNLEVNVAMDLGMDDTCFLVFWQQYHKEVRIINEYENNGLGLESYVKIINDTGYNINWVITPHDIKVRDLGSGITRLETLRRLGVRRIKVLKKQPIQDGIEAFRQVMLNLYIDSSCTRVQACIKNYSKAWDDINKTWSKKPNHNQWSNGADALRYLALGKIIMLPRNENRVRKDNNIVDGLSLG